MANKAPNYEGVGCDEPYVLTDVECGSCDRGLEAAGVLCRQCTGKGYVTEKAPLRDFIEVEE